MNYKFDMASTEDKQQTPQQEEFNRQTIHSLGQGSLISETELAHCTPKSLVSIPFNYSHFLLHPAFLLSKTSKETHPLPIYRSLQMDSLDINARLPRSKVPLSPRGMSSLTWLYIVPNGCLNSVTSMRGKRKQNLRKQAVKTKMADPI
jgi:hypothetical protein